MPRPRPRCGCGGAIGRCGALLAATVSLTCLHPAACHGGAGAYASTAPKASASAAKASSVDAPASPEAPSLAAQPEQMAEAAGADAAPPKAGRAADDAAAVQPQGSARGAATGQTASAAAAEVAKKDARVVAGTLGDDVLEPLVPLPDDAAQDWEAAFAWGLYFSKVALKAEDVSALRWVTDHFASDAVRAAAAAVPHGMLRAEELLTAAVSAALPASRQKEKKAELALRLYHHAKWLAERNYARGAEQRYRAASRTASAAKRSVLAAHALSRLGYFLMHWRRQDEAREVLLESERLNKKSNPLAPFLFGVLERRVAGADLDRLLSAEARIMDALTQPSEELELQRRDLTQQIEFWRAAERSPQACFAASDVAQALICIFGHAASGLHRVAFGSARPQAVPPEPLSPAT